MILARSLSSECLRCSIIDHNEFVMLTKIATFGFVRIALALFQNVPVTVELNITVFKCMTYLWSEVAFLCLEFLNEQL